MRHRPILLAGMSCLSPAVLARPARSGGLAIRLGADPALVQSGLANAVVGAFGRDTGLAVRLVAAPALPLLDGLAAGEMDAALVNAPEAEAQLEAQGLVHDRQLVAVGEFVLIGPAAMRAGAAMTEAPGRPVRPGAPVTVLRRGEMKGLPIASSIAVPAGIAELLARVREAATGPRPGEIGRPATVTFLSAADGSGTHLAEQAAWRVARIAPAAPWYQRVGSCDGLVREAVARHACTFVERGAWTVQAASSSSLVILAANRDVLGERVHVMRSFRSPHPAGRLLTSWLAGARGRAVAAAVPGYRRADGGPPVRKG